MRNFFFKKRTEGPLFYGTIGFIMGYLFGIILEGILGIR